MGGVQRLTVPQPSEEELNGPCDESLVVSGSAGRPAGYPSGMRWKRNCSGRRQRAAAQSSNSGNQPRLTVDKPVVDFGKIPYDQRVTPTWKLTNSGNAPLQIKDFKLDVVEGC